MAKINVWVVSAYSVDYDDEVYYTIDGGCPTGVYLTQERAQAEAVRLQASMEATENINEYQPSYDADGAEATEWPEFYFVTKLEIEESDIVRPAPTAPAIATKTQKAQMDLISKRRSKLGGIIRPK